MCMYTHLLCDSPVTWYVQSVCDWLMVHHVVCTLLCDWLIAFTGFVKTRLKIIGEE